LPVTEKNGYIVGFLPLTAGHHHDSFELAERMKTLFKSLKKQFKLPQLVYFNADTAFDSRGMRKVCFNYSVVPNIKFNPRNRKNPKRGRKRLFNPSIYQHRFTAERTFAWLDNFRTLATRYERSLTFWLGFHFIASTLINFKSLV